MQSQWRFTLVFSCKNLIVLALTLRSLNHFELLFCTCCGERSNFIIFCMWLSSCPQHHLLKKTILFSIQLSCTFFECQLTISVRGYFSAFNFIPLIYVSVLILVPPCRLDYCGFVVSFGSLTCESSQLCSFQGSFGCFTQNFAVNLKLL